MPAAASPLVRTDIPDCWLAPAMVREARSARGGDLAHRVRARLEDAIHVLHCERVDPGPRTYCVDGRTEPHYLDLDRPWGEQCDCKHHEGAHELCAHIACALLFDGGFVYDRPLNAVHTPIRAGIFTLALVIALQNEKRRAERKRREAALAGNGGGR